jgi:hypothetical protein
MWRTSSLAHTGSAGQGRRDRPIWPRAEDQDLGEWSAGHAVHGENLDHISCKQAPNSSIACCRSCTHVWAHSASAGSHEYLHLMCSSTLGRCYGGWARMRGISRRQQAEDLGMLGVQSIPVTQRRSYSSADSIESQQLQRIVQCSCHGDRANFTSCAQLFLLVEIGPTYSFLSPR